MQACLAAFSGAHKETLAGTMLTAEQVLGSGSGECAHIQPLVKLALN